MAEREQFGRDELAIVLSHYDIGVIEHIEDFPRGSRKAPKLLLTSPQGEFLLKRRAQGKDDAVKVAFTHQLQTFLALKQFPLPHLIGTRDDNNSLLQWTGCIYELFEYIRGNSYNLHLDSTFDGGRILGLYHKLLKDFTSDYEPPYGSYHDSKFITGSLDKIPATFAAPQWASKINSELLKSGVLRLRQAYKEAARRVEDLGLSDWPLQIVHGDWHPGNMLFRNNKVVGVIDYDTARMQQRVIDMANGALQFSITGGTEDPSTWPDYLDESRFKRFVSGYDTVYKTTPDQQLSVAEIEAIPSLMIEAMVAEAAIPIAATGSFGRMEGYGFLQMMERKVRWVQKNAPQIIERMMES